MLRTDRLCRNGSARTGLRVGLDCPYFRKSATPSSFHIHVKSKLAMGVTRHN